MKVYFISFLFFIYKRKNLLLYAFCCIINLSNILQKLVMKHETTKTLLVTLSFFIIFPNIVAILLLIAYIAYCEISFNWNEELKNKISKVFFFLNIIALFFCIPVLMSLITLLFLIVFFAMKKQNKNK